jgi:hypothetical protein
MLGAPDETLHIEWVDTDSASETLLDEEFSPEAVIAEGLSPSEAAQYAESYQQETHFGIDLFIKDDG